MLTTEELVESGTSKWDKAIRLNIGGGPIKMDGFVNYDIANGDDARKLPYPDASVDEIYASHVLEHIGAADAQNTLNEWARVLVPGGRCRIAVPDAHWWAKELIEGRCPDPCIIMGGQTNEHDFHKCMFNEAGLALSMARAGLNGIGKWQSRHADCASLPCSLNLEGYKPLPVKRRIAAVTSVPRLTFSENVKCAFENLFPMKIPVHYVTGVYWYQCMERAMSEEVSKDAEWIVTIDNDTLWTPQKFDRLCVLLESNPHIDAIAPLQVKRGREGVALMKPLPGAKAEGPDELLPVQWMHFGLTLFRVSALKKVEHPWFMPKPGKDGWGDGRVDADVAFWDRWREAGNTAYVASRIPVGHMQNMAGWPSEDGGIIYQHTDEFWEKRSEPMGVRM